MKRSRHLARVPRGWIYGALGALGGILLFDLLVMPMFVRRGADAEVPDLVGQPATQAERLLGGEGLRVGELTRSYDDRVAAGSILRHNPPAGMVVKRGRAVDLMISLGPEALRVPALEGESMTHARFLLQRERLDLGRVRAIQSPEVERDCVIASQPPSATQLAGRTQVDLLVSSGPPPARYIMPDLRGHPAEAARALLSAAGFTVHLSGARDGEASGARVSRQTPVPGRPITSGEEIELALAR